MRRIKQAIIIRADLKMGKGKIAAQCSHAAIEAYEKAMQKDGAVVLEWKGHGMPKIVLKVNSEKELLTLFEQAKRIVPAALIKDAGKTQVEPGTATCIALGPADEAEIDRFTKSLKLL